MTSKLFSTQAASNAAVNEATDNLLSAEAQNSARATAELLRVAMAKRPQTKEDMLEVRRLSIQAFEQGNTQTAFGVAMTYLFTKEDDSAREWVSKGAEANDWRCKYANALLQSGTNLRDTLRVVAKAKYEEFASYSVEQKTPKTPDSIAPKPISMKPPVYPAGLDVVGAKGTVMAEFVVDPNGVPTKIKVLDATHPELANAVMTAVAGWRFTPGIKNGKAVSARMRVPVNFQPLK